MLLFLHMSPGRVPGTPNPHLHLHPGGPHQPSELLQRVTQPYLHRYSRPPPPVTVSSRHVTAPALDWAKGDSSHHVRPESAFAPQGGAGGGGCSGGRGEGGGTGDQAGAGGGGAAVARAGGGAQSELSAPTAVAATRPHTSLPTRRGGGGLQAQQPVRPSTSPGPSGIGYRGQALSGGDRTVARPDAPLQWQQEQQGAAVAAAAEIFDYESELHGLLRCSYDTFQSLYSGRGGEGASLQPPLSPPTCRPNQSPPSRPTSPASPGHEQRPPARGGGAAGAPRQRSASPGSPRQHQRVGPCMAGRPVCGWACMAGGPVCWGACMAGGPVCVGACMAGGPGCVGACMAGGPGCVGACMAAGPGCVYVCMHACMCVCVYVCACRCVG